jgi:iron complex outermembrane receptor protein
MSGFPKDAGRGLGCALFLSSGAAVAQDPAADDVLDVIVVTATRMESALRDVPRSISVVDRERIQNGTQQLGLDEALAGVPGLYMQNRYNFAQDLRISLRGFGARSSFGIRGIKIIVDGIPETLPDGQGGVDSIDLGSANRIEVLRGPASSLYGNASGGVISVESERGDGAPFVEGTIAGGSYDYRKAQLKAAGATDRMDFMVNASTQELDGYRDHSRFEGTLLNSKLAFQVTDRDELLLSLNHSDQPMAQDPGGITAEQAASDPSSARDRNVAFDTGEELDQQRLGLVYRTDRTGGDLMLRNYYVWRDFSNRLPFVGGGSVKLDRFYYGLGAQYTLDELASDRLALTFGFDLDRQDDQRKRFDNNMGSIGALVFDQDEKVDSNGVYLQAKYSFDDTWGMSAGLRFDRISYDVRDRYLSDGDNSGQLDFNQASPSLGFSYATQNGTAFVSYSRSFETPTTTELANPDGSGGFNQDLKAQTADNFELGYKSAIGGLFYELSVFRINLEDELVPFELPAFPGRTFFQNSGSSSRRGVEAAMAWRHDTGFGVDVSYTYSDFKFDDFVDDNGNNFSGNRLPGQPQHAAYLGLSYRTEPGLKATLEAIYSGELSANNANTVEVKSYVVSNFRLSYEYASGNWMLRPYAGINNIFGESYNSNIRINAFGGRYFEPAPPRNYYAGIVVNFRKKT